MGSNETLFPVYVNLADLGADFFSNVNADGGDIRVTNSDGTTELAREVVDVNTGAQTGELHFRADSLSSSSPASFYIYYGNIGASDYAFTATHGRNAVWSTNYSAAYHHDEEAAGTTSNSTTIPRNFAGSSMRRPAATRKPFSRWRYATPTRPITLTPTIRRWP